VRLSGDYGRLRERLAELSDVRKAGELLAWDQAVTMPAAGAAARAEQRATLDRLAHELLTAAETGRLLDRLRTFEESHAPDSDEASLIRVTRRQYERERRVPAALRGEMAAASAHGLVAWAEAKRTRDFQLLRPFLERSFELRRRYAECLDEAGDPYGALVGAYDPDVGSHDVDAVFGAVREELVPLVAELAAHDDAVAGAVLERRFPAEAQCALAREAVEAIFGFRPGSWRLDPAAHPFFASGGVDDVRLATTFMKPGLYSLFATLHEGGHALYEHNVDPALARTPLAGGASASAHESQSQLWDLVVGRSRPFWRFFYPRVQAAFPGELGGVQLDAFCAALDRVRPTALVERSGEVEFTVHLLVRVELERELLAGTLAFRDLPSAWNDRVERYLGVRAEGDEGVLEDPHWADGLIGYYPTYTLGVVVAVQLWERACKDLPGLPAGIERGEFGELRGWLREHVHRHGRKFTLPELLARVTGEQIDPGPYLRYLQQKFRERVPA
jgi:carboxypeptidase Taq